MKHYIKLTVFFFGIIASVNAKENTSVFRYAAPNQPDQVFAGCDPSKSRADLDINNVRTPIWINGDMWWDLSGNALYEVPAGSGKHSLFAGAIWFGGKDGAAGNLKVAAQTYRQSGSDFWPGPIDISTTTISPHECLKYDKHFKITFAEVKSFHEQYQVNGDLSYPIPDVIKNWPANGDANYHEDNILAPFHDDNSDGYYDYLHGDYPKYNIDPSLGQDPCDKGLLLGDQTIWWVFNDVGNIHGETGSLLPVGVEIQAQAFAFNTNDEINNMTFYRYKIINRATTILTDTYFGSWVDPDLGNYLDDFVGCDVGRGLGYCYNGDADDDGALGYGINPPAVGMDFFEGPLADPFDGIDNDRDSIIDEPGEQIIMSKFVYYNNDNTNIGNPNNAQQYYNYLDGKWKDNNPLVYGGTGYLTSSNIPCNFMFPDDTDPLHIGTGGIDPLFDWSENQPCKNCPPNTPSDRRFLQSAGKFTLLPGAINYITTGAVWARTSSGGPLASVKLLKIADVKAQNLFESCFKVLDGPDAPVLSLRELDKEIIISLQNPSGSNNAGEKYREKDSNIPTNPNAFFTFEGYKVFQVKDPSVSINDLHNPDKARLIPQGQSDIQNGLSQIVNKTLDGDLNAYVPVEEVVGADKGLKHSFRVTTDLFATGDPKLVNHKTYYFLAIAYAYDSVADVLDPFVTPPGLYGQPYIQSRKNADGSAVSVYTAIPHIPDPEANGLTLSTSFGDGPEITRITGIGNGYNFGSDRGTLDLKQDQIDNILFNQSNPTIRILNPTYQRGRGPVDIRIYDPVNVPASNFELWLTDTTVNYSFNSNLNFDSSYTPIDTLSVPGPVYSLRIGQVVTSSYKGFPKESHIVQIIGTGPYQIILSSPITASDTLYTYPNISFSIAADSHWILKNLSNNKIDTSEKTIEFPYDQLFPEYGFSVSMNQVKEPGEYPSGGNGAIEGTMEFDNPGKQWLGFVPDVDNVPQINWICSGNNIDATIYDTPDYKDLDGSQFYEKILTRTFGPFTGGTWAPFRLVSRNSNGVDYIAPAPFINGGSYPQDLDSLNYLGSVDIVITPDKNKWSRCVVFEMGSGTDPTLNEGTEGKNLIRKHPSMNLDGSYSSTDSGYSWFPGYAINVETGERLNIAFSEDSRLINDHGNDMKWNPTSSSFDDSTFQLLAGGKHYIYVFGHKNPEAPISNIEYGPAYDSCNFIYGKLWGLNPYLTTSQSRNKVKAGWKDCMWVGCPVLTPGQSLLNNAVTIRLRVTKPYRAYDTGVQNSVNNNFPYYKFGTGDLVAKVNQPDVAKNALSLINVVPNPYYAYSNYEANQLDNRIKIVNLPAKCVITIYSTSGTLIRQFKRDAGAGVDYNNTSGEVYPEVNLESSVDWDLKNSAGVPIASGIYLIHVKVDGIGERTLKWFGVMRPIDLDTF